MVLVLEAGLRAEGLSLRRGHRTKVEPRDQLDIEARLLDGAATTLVFTLTNSGTNPAQAAITVGDTLPTGLAPTGADSQPGSPPVAPVPLPNGHRDLPGGMHRAHDPADYLLMSAMVAR